MNVHYYPKIKAFVDLRPESILAQDGTVWRRLCTENGPEISILHSEAMKVLIPLRSITLENVGALE